MSARSRYRRTTGGGAAGVAGALALILTAVVACGPTDAEDVPPVQTDTLTDDHAAPPPPTAPARAASEAVPTLFGFGRPADSARLAAWDIDVMPDGRGLPPGSGSIEAGAEVYATSCAPCHGDAGQGGPNDRLVAEEDDSGRAIGAYWPYASTLYDYIRRAMPWDRPGSLSDDEVYAVVAWLLYQNGLIEEGVTLDAETLAGVTMPAMGLFVPDDREAYTAVR